MAEQLLPTYNFIDDRLNELKEIFPEAFEDGVFNVDTLRQLIGDFSTDNSYKEHFGLNWVGKTESKKKASTHPTGTLNPCIGLGVNEDTTENIFIEGENLEVLKILRKSYAGKIKMIFIDPPYNTGNDFVYKDDFADSTDEYLKKLGDKSEEGLLVSNPKTAGKYHANWLSFMYPRLKLAQDLLEDKGVMFISIDDNEVANLILICNEIFGERNVELYVWDVREDGTMPKTAKRTVRKEHEYIIGVYKNKDDIKLSKYSDNKYSENDNWTNADNDPRGPWMSGNISRNQVESTDGEKYFEIITPTGVSYKRNWAITKIEFQAMLDDKRIYFADNGNGVPRKKIFKDEPVLAIQSSVFDNLKSSQYGKKEIKSLIGDVGFDYPKPTTLLKRLIQIGSKSDSIILDFFGGSGSTAQAVVDLNMEENSNRKFIIIQLPEQTPVESKARKIGFNSISEICLSRIKASLTKYLNHFGVKVYKQDKSCLYKWQDFDPNSNGGIVELHKQLQLTLKNPMIEGTSIERLATEIVLQKGFSLSSTFKEVAKNIILIKDNSISFNLFLCTSEKIIIEDIAKIEIDKNDHFICFDNAFESDSVKQNIDNRCKLFTI